MAQERLDILLVKRNLAESREKAKIYIKTGIVFINGIKAQKASLNIEETAIIEIRGETLKYVSRGGLKLEKAVEQFGISLEGQVCMDVGASTGGFTDCMLQHGAERVFAIDVGTSQLVGKLREDARVICMENTNIRYVTKEDIGEFVDFVSIDVSFISLSKVLAPVYELMKENAQIVCLIKPQFEAGKEKIGKKGVVRDKKVHEGVIVSVTSFATAIGLELLGLEYSPIKGPEGNIEYLLYARKCDKKELCQQSLQNILLMVKELVNKAHNSLLS